MFVTFQAIIIGITTIVSCDGRDSQLQADVSLSHNNLHNSESSYLTLKVTLGEMDIICCQTSLAIRM